MIIRKLRDEWLLRQEGGPAMIAEYYLLAPKIVEAINLKLGRKLLFESVYLNYVLPCVRSAKAENFEECRRIFADMMSTLKAEYL